MTDSDITGDIELCLRELGHKRWLMHYFNDESGLTAIGATLTWPSVVDVLILRSEMNALAYRTPKVGGIDPFIPEYVLCSFSGSSLWTLRWILTLDPPGNELPPLSPVPSGFAMRRSEVRPVRISPAATYYTTGTNS